jgi:hypothetical protein
MTQESTAVKKRWFSYKGKKVINGVQTGVTGFCLAIDGDEVIRNEGLLPDGLVVEPAEWNGEEFVIVEGNKGDGA